MKFLREPLVQFLVLGAAIFVLYDIVTRHQVEKPGEILVKQGTIANLATGFIQTWQRPPSENELGDLVQDYIRDEVAYREALTLGLDRDDLIIRRRLRQKLEFLTDALTDRDEPSEQQLQVFLEQHAALFRSDPTFSFVQIYFDPRRHGESLERNMAHALDYLGHTPKPANTNGLGDPFLLGRSFDHLSIADIRKTFGDDFAASVRTLSVGVWRGPISSGYGAHLVFVTERTDGRVPPLAEVRDNVRREFLYSRHREATDRYYRELLEKRYTVKFEQSMRRVAKVP